MLPAGFDIIPGTDGQLFTGSRNTAAGMNKPRWAMITDSAGANPVLYGWREQTWQQTPGSTNGIGLADMSGGMFGTTVFNPAIEPNGVTLNVGDYVKLELAYFDPLYDWVFAVMKTGGGGGGGSTTPAFGEAYGTFGGSLTGIAAGAQTAIPWNTGRSSFWSSASRTRFTIPSTQPDGGAYSLRGVVVFGTGDNQTSTHAKYSAQWYKNGTYGSPTQYVPGFCDGYNLVVIAETTMEPLNYSTNDYVELVVYHTTSNPSGITIVGVEAEIVYRGTY